MPVSPDFKDSLFQVSALLARRLAVVLRDALAPHGLHPAQFVALNEIAAREGLTQAELAIRLEVEQPGVARTLSALSADGWIERSTLGKGRAQGLYLSQRARTVLPEATAAVAAAERRAMASLGRTEAALLVDALAMLAADIRD